MLEKLSKEEITQLISELNMQGYKTKMNVKEIILQQEAEKLGFGDVYIYQNYRNPIYLLADVATKNKIKKGNKTYRNKTVDPCIESEWRKIVSDLLGCLKPYIRGEND